jgi:hypothetical protein
MDDALFTPNPTRMRWKGKPSRGFVRESRPKQEKSQREGKKRVAAS